MEQNISRTILEDKKRVLENAIEKKFNNANKMIDEAYLDESEKDFSNIVEEKNENVIKDKGNFKFRTFKEVILVGTVIATVVTGGALITKKPWLNKQEKLINDLTIEADIHGGIKSEIDDEFKYNLNKHLESGDCIIKGEGSPSERIERVCEENGISDSVTDAIITRFELNYNRKYKEAEKIKPLKIYQKEQEELKNQDKSYGM